MFNIGWTEMMVIAAVAIIVVGPKDLPRMLRTFGKTMGQVRRTANDFKRQFNDALREAEREAGLDETRAQLKKAVEPVTSVKKDLDKTVRDASRAVEAPSPNPGKPDDPPHPAEPLKTGATSPTQGSDAA